MRHARTRTGAVLLTLAVGTSCSDDGERPAAEANRITDDVLIGHLSADADDSASTTTQPRTAPPTAPEAPPVEFTACIDPGPVVQDGTEEPIAVPLPDGEMTIVQMRGATFRQSLTSVTDPRLEGTLHNAWDEDAYILPGNEQGLNIVTFTDRIENDEGAWQGSVVMLRLAG